MIPIQRRSLKVSTQKTLNKRHTSASKLTRSNPRIQQRWEYFLRAGANRAAYDDVRTTLDVMFRGKCCYCEKVISKDIEHFYPKTIYPQRMFSWENMLRACKDCNFEKHNADPDLPPDDRGQRSLLDPTIDRPEDYIHWDLATGLPTYPGAGPGAGPRIHRGKRTVEVCKLDNQKFNDMRRERAKFFLYIVNQAIDEAPVRPDTRELLDELLDANKPWLGVIRQIVRDPAQSARLDLVLLKLPHLAPRVAELRWTHP